MTGAGRFESTTQKLGAGHQMINWAIKTDKLKTELNYCIGLEQQHIAINLRQNTSKIASDNIN